MFESTNLSMNYINPDFIELNSSFDLNSQQSNSEHNDKGILSEIKEGYLNNLKSNALPNEYKVNLEDKNLINSKSDSQDILVELYETKNNKKKNIIFEVIYPEKKSLSTSNKTISKNDELNINFLIHKRYRSKNRRSRGRNFDNLRIMIKRNFLNKHLLNDLNEELDKLGYKTKFYKFPQTFVGDVTIENNKQILDKTLGQIFEMKVLYKGKFESNYYHNLKIVESLKKKEKPDFLNMKYSDLFQKYLNSEEFEIHANSLLENLKKFNENDLQIYKFLAKSFIQHYSK